VSGALSASRFGAVGIFLGKESALVNGNGFGYILGRESFGKLSGLFKPSQIVEVPGKPVAHALFALDAIHMDGSRFLGSDS